MESKTLGALILVALVAGVNLFMYGLVRAWTKPGFLDRLGQSFNATQKKDDSMDELHRKLEELKKGKKADAEESES